MYEPDMENVHLFPNACGRLGNHYWAHPNILREGEPLRGEGRAYDEFPGLHLHIRDPWSTLARVLSTAEGAFFGKLGNTSKISYEPFEILNPGHIYRYIVCNLKERRVQNFQQPNFKRMPLQDFAHAQLKPWFLEANKARFPYAYPSSFKGYNFDCSGPWKDKLDYYKSKGLM
eukprot:gnl/MRDRNA2_/MRDRNA2_23882_c0_seq1.p1 gnl/MRDRNA2_/MRDRNA2_23882_c0~~gnl/MRDRNA2_/MRDRNA2_23882_c0_seq1.p1  ORF type:complete len:173 (+),score=17.01 gnl/MRDRNA2_/MRDRNA2_23882_c0_seq1:118-636(+)